MSVLLTNSIFRGLGDNQRGPVLPQSWTSRSLYRWLIDILHRQPDRFPVLYTPAHTSVSTPEALASRIAGGSATAAQRQPLRSPSAPLPTFFLDSFLLSASDYGFVESNISSLVSHLMVFTDAGIHPYSSLMPSLYDPTPPPSGIFVPPPHIQAWFSFMLNMFGRLDLAVYKHGVDSGAHNGSSHFHPLSSFLRDA